MSKAKQITFETTFDVYNSEADLSTEDQVLIAKAKLACLSAYAPYSGFFVGAAILLSNGEIISGNNQENAAYPSGMCAERTALYYAASQFPNQNIKSIAVVFQTTHGSTNTPLSPCGACRQAIAEYEFKSKLPIKIIMASQSGEIYIAPSIKSLLPLAFNKDQLK